MVRWNFATSRCHRRHGGNPRARPLCRMSRAYRHSRHRGWPSHVPPRSTFLVHPMTSSSKAQGHPQQHSIPASHVRLSLRPQQCTPSLIRNRSQVVVYSAVPGPGPPIKLAGGGGIEMSIFCTGPSELSGLSILAVVADYQHRHLDSCGRTCVRRWRRRQPLLSLPRCDSARESRADSDRTHTPFFRAALFPACRTRR